jgi:hypothetical protein
MAGCITNAGPIYVKMYPPYNLDNVTGYVNTGVIPSGTRSNYSDLSIMDDKIGFIPVTANGSVTTYVCDAFWYNNSGINYLIGGGYYGEGTKCGPRCFNTSIVYTYSGSTVGSRISYIEP